MSAQHHECREVNQAVTNLLDDLCMWERDTGRESVVLILPYHQDERTVCAVNGKPANFDDPHLIISEIAAAYQARGDTKTAMALHQVVQDLIA
jgi:hypothetical protein